MKKILLALLTAGTMGCGSYNKEIHLYDPLENYQSESLLQETAYINDKDNQCHDWVYTTAKLGRLSSVRKTNHCVYNRGKVMGTIYSVRYDDTDEDGLVDRICEIEGISHLGVIVVTTETCVDEKDGKPLLYFLQQAIK